MIACRYLGVAVGFMMSIATFASAAEQVPSEAYKSWSRHKVGTSVLMKQTMNMQGMSINMDRHQVLKSVAEDKVVVTTWSTMDMGGMKRDTPRQDITIKAMVDKGNEEMPAGYDGKIEILADETITVAGKEYQCKVIKFTGKAEGADADGKVWNSHEVPGNTVKMEMKTSGERAGEIKMELAEVNEK